MGKGAISLHWYKLGQGKDFHKDFLPPPFPPEFLDSGICDTTFLPFRYHVVVYIMLCCNYFPVVLNHLAMAIYGARTTHHCHLPDNAYPNTSIPWDAQKGRPQSCLVYMNYTKDSGETESCAEGWDYDLGPRESNIISEV